MILVSQPESKICSDIKSHKIVLNYGRKVVTIRVIGSDRFRFRRFDVPKIVTHLRDIRFNNPRPETRRQNPSFEYVTISGTSQLSDLAAPDRGV